MSKIPTRPDKLTITTFRSKRDGHKYRPWKLSVRYRGFCLLEAYFKTKSEAHDYAAEQHRLFHFSALPQMIDSLKEHIKETLIPLDLNGAANGL